jgi:hypothetical protein
MIMNCSDGRKYSRLQIIKNRLRTKINKNRLNHLSILNTVCNVLDDISFKNIINYFAKKKFRKKQFK